MTLPKMLAVTALVALATGCAKAPRIGDIEAQGTQWGQALTSRDPERITSLYADDAVLLATYQTKAEGSGEIRSYFDGLTKNEGLTVAFEEQNPRALGPGAASNSGTYTFSFMKDGKKVEVPARFTFLYRKEGGDWRIVEHHSSVRP